MNWSIDPLLELQIWTRLAAMAYGQATSHDLFQAVCSRALALDKPALFRPDSYVFCVGVCVGQASARRPAPHFQSIFYE